MKNVTYLAMTVVMAEHMEPGEDRDTYRERTLARLAEAVEAESRRRSRCRDTDVRAATRTRAW